MSDQKKTETCRYCGKEIEFDGMPYGRWFSVIGRSYSCHGSNHAPKPNRAKGAPQ